MKNRKSFLALLALLALVLAGCSRKQVLHVYTWADYFSPEVIARFEKENDCIVKQDIFDSNEMMYTKLMAGDRYDVIIPSDYMIERLIAEDALMELDYSRIPNANGMLDWLKDTDYDAGSRHSVPYMWGTVGILYNEEYVDEPITSWKSLFDPKYQDDVFMLKSVRDTIGVTLKMLGYSVNENSEKALNEVRDVLIKQKQDGIVQGYMVDEVKEKMISGEAAMAVMWSGDAMYAIMGNDSLKYVVPEEGSNIFYDSICIPANARNVSGAEKFIDFLCRGDIAAMNYEYVGYAIPNTAAIDIIGADEYNASPVNNPSQEALDHCEVFKYLGDDTKLYDQVWTEIISEF